MTALFVLILTAALATGHYLAAAAVVVVLALPTALRVGSRHAVRRTGVSMIRTGTHRLWSGRL